MKQLELNLAFEPASGRRDVSSEVFIADRLAKSPTGENRLLESILEPENMQRALERVVANEGAPGVDGMTVHQLRGYYRRQWPTIRAALLAGTYRPLPVRRKEIPKPTGGVRLLGIPVALDRLIQQAMAQALTAIWDHTFSDYSFGFRPNRCQHDAIRQCQEHIRAGYRMVVDLDLAKFFDRVHHDRLLARLATRITDKRVLRLIRRYLEAGVMIGGVFAETIEGTPQGGPISPLLSNIVLDELDKELEKRGLHFVRYADDCVIYVGSQRAGDRVLGSVTRFIERKLRLEVNATKSAVGRPWNRKYLGFCFTDTGSGPRIRLHMKTVARLRERVRQITSRGRGRSLQQVIAELNAYLRSWWGYFGIIESGNRLTPLAPWIRRRLRALVWHQWKTRRRRVGQLLARGITRDYALTTGCARKGTWRMSRVKWVVHALPNRYFESLGLAFPWQSPA